MSLTFDELKEKAAAAEEAEMNEENNADYPEPAEPAEPIEDLAPEPDEVPEVTDPVRPEDETPEGDPEPVEPVEPELDEDGNPVEPEFSFDPKIKVMDDEFEVPEFLAKHVTNEEEAKVVRELAEKAFGLDAVKEKRDHYKTQVQETETKYNEVNQELSKTNENLDFLDNLIKTGDMQTFQQYAGISDDALLKRAAEIIQYRELTPTQKAEYDRNIQSRQRQYALEFENKDLRQNHESSEVQKTHEALDNALSLGDTQSIASEFDSKVGYGAFKNEVIRRAQDIAQRTGKSLSPQEAIEETVKSLGLQPSQVEQNPEPTQQPAQQVPVEQRVVVKEKKPTMTSVKAGAKSPVKAKVKSIDDIRKLAQQFDH